jgi:NAD(P)-dependent dehydrogenase (short-subunit alcohol dehydrogenase family)
VKVLGYCASKAALNMFTGQLAFELKDQDIAVATAELAVEASRDFRDAHGTPSVRNTELQSRMRAAITRGYQTKP